MPVKFKIDPFLSTTKNPVYLENKPFLWAAYQQTADSNRH